MPHSVPIMFLPNVNHDMKHHHPTCSPENKSKLTTNTPGTSLWRRFRNSIFSCVLAWSALLGGASRLAAGTQTVTFADDSGPGSLRQAVLAAASGDIIVFDPSLNGQTITLTSGEIDVNTSVTITGPGSALLTISGNNASRVFHFAGGASILSGVTIAQGNVAGGNGTSGNGGGGGGGGMGAGVLADSSSTVSIQDVILANNAVTGGNGGGNNDLGSGAAGGTGKGGSSGALAQAGEGIAGYSGGAAGATAGGGGGGSSSGVGAAGPGGNGSYGGGGGGGGGNGGYGAPGGAGGISGGFGGAGAVGAFSTTGGSGGGGAGLGGGLCVWQNAFVMLSNVTFQANSATGGSGGSGAQNGQGKGGAIFVFPGAVVEETNLTFTGNSSQNGGAGILSTDGLLTDNADIYGAFLSLNPVTNAVVYASASLWTDSYGDFFTDDTDSLPGEVVDWVANVDPNYNLDVTALQFDLTALSGTVTSVFLRLHVCQSFGAPYLSVYGSLDNTWTEANTNMPLTLNQPIDVNDVTGLAAGGWKYVDVTSFVNTILSGSKIASFELTNEIYGVDNSGDGFAFDSFQSSILLLRPALLINSTALVVLTNTTLTITNGPSPSTWGVPVTFTATVTPAGGTMAPTGVVNFLEGETLLGSASLVASEFGATATISTTNLPVGIFELISAEYAGDSDFDGSTNYALQFVNPAAQSALVFTLAAAGEYGSTNALSVSGGSGLGGVSFIVLSGPGEIFDGTNLVLTAGTGEVVIQATKGGDEDYAAATTNVMMEALPAPLTITADTQTKIYGAALPALTASYIGFVNGDSSGSLTAPPVLTTTATANSHVAGNPYAINVSSAVDANYTIFYASGTLLVLPASLTITANNESKLYGAALPTLTASYSGFVNGDIPGNLTFPPILTTTATAGSHASGNPYSITAGGAVDSDYVISYVAGTLAVIPAPLTIFANNQAKIYGAALPTLTASYSGLVNGDNSASLTAQPALITSATAGSHVSGSPYVITAAGAADADYEINYTNGSLTVTPAPLTITADNQTTTYGAVLPTLTASYTGLVNGDMQGALTTLPTLTTTATSNSHVSGNPFNITASGAVDADYTISYVSGNLTITAAELTITANNQIMTYGWPLPTLTASYTGLVNGDLPGSLTTPPTLTTTATINSHVNGSPFSITASGAIDSDYVISYVSGTLSVISAPLTITADNQTKAYGAALPTLTASYSDLRNGDTPTSLATPPTLATTATASSPMGAYPITISGAVDPDYMISYVSGILAVSPVSLTVTANNAMRAYGTTNPVFTGTIVGLLIGFEFTSSYSLDAVTNSPAGMYQILPALVDPLNLAANYNVFLIDAELDVVAALVLSTNPVSYVVGDKPINLDTNAMVNDGNSVNYAGGLLTVTIVTNADPGDELAVSSQGTNAGQISVQGTNVSYGGVAFASLSQTSNSLVVNLGSNGVTSGALTALLREVTFATDDASTNFLVIQVALDYGSNTVLASRVVLLDIPPVARDVFITATKGVAVSFLISDLLTNVTDANGYAITLASVNSISDEGGLITANATMVTYTPPHNLAANEDEFGVLYSDGHGGEAVGFVTLDFLPPNQLQIDVSQLSTTGVQLTLGGTPNAVYDVEVSTDLLNWSLLETVTASPTGIIGVLDVAAKNMPYRFYRAVAE